jgi:uncharacterized membrane protein YfcA
MAAGLIGSAGGITSLVSYAALLAVGVAPLAANVTNSVALLGSGSAAAVRGRPDVSGHRETLRQWIPLTVGFSVAGAVLLVLTPAGVFNRLVPLLVAVGALALLLQPAIASSLKRRERTLQRGVVMSLGAGIAIYNGYFGAGSGILIIAVLLLTAEPVLYRANALKNVILVTSDVLPAIVFAASGTVAWHDAWPLCLGAIAGGLTGPAVTRRVPAKIMRIAIGTFGLGFAGWLLVKP